ncbi:MAG: STM4014 family protein [Lachnospiraceae bacterium]|nr:STM4014 family protein [Lachnospiraceae bacterium]MCM1240758.1 STM4014 family protein [Lachnospiraceae bacterium]MCM1240827.1 STM4014 family protein [Lachnospiraceae bacterium]
MEREDMVQRDADGIAGIILIGSAGSGNLEGGKNSEGSKRKAYFEQAAAAAGVRVSFYDWKDFPFTGKIAEIENSVVKIDAPEWDSCHLKELDALTGRYGEQLLGLSRMPFGAFLNHPLDIAEALDKRKCKKRLKENGVPVTEMCDGTFSRKDDLLDFMRENRMHQVFLKPTRGSGAAGVTAFRFSPVRGRMALYTCAALDRGELVNTKKLYRLEGEDAGRFLERLLELDCVVEKWHRKATFREYSYDLRVVVQDGRIDYILPRLSKGPITNLHLNNHSMEFKALNLDQAVVRGIEETCVMAAGCYPRLKSVGMDVLLEKESLKPYVIEMNAQGDLLHRDVYGENRIYRRQIEIMSGMMERLLQNGNGKE